MKAESDIYQTCVGKYDECLAQQDLERRCRRAVCRFLGGYHTRCALIRTGGLPYIMKGTKVLTLGAGR